LLSFSFVLWHLLLLLLLHFVRMLVVQLRLLLPPWHP
jgi:hypothetical protein